MAESITGLVRRFVELFNRDMAEITDEQSFSAELRELLIEEPVIVPMRAALEGIEYSGPSALEDFAQAVAESWTHLEIVMKEIRELDDNRLLVLGDLAATARETGVEVRQPVGWLMVFREGKIAEIRTYTSEREALEAAQR